MGPEEQRRWHTTCRNEKTKPKWDPVKSKLSRIRSESDQIGKVLRFDRVAFWLPDRTGRMGRTDRTDRTGRDGQDRTGRDRTDGQDGTDGRDRTDGTDGRDRTDWIHGRDRTDGTASHLDPRCGLSPAALPPPPAPP